MSKFFQGAFVGAHLGAAVGASVEPPLPMSDFIIDRIMKGQGGGPQKLRPGEIGATGEYSMAGTIGLTRLVLPPGSLPGAEYSKRSAPLSALDLANTIQSAYADWGKSRPAFANKAMIKSAALAPDPEDPGLIKRVFRQACIGPIDPESSCCLIRMIPVALVLSAPFKHVMDKETLSVPLEFLKDVAMICQLDTCMTHPSPIPSAAVVAFVTLLSHLLSTAPEVSDDTEEESSHIEGTKDIVPLDKRVESAVAAAVASIALFGSGPTMSVKTWIETGLNESALLSTKGHISIVQQALEFSTRLLTCFVHKHESCIGCAGKPESELPQKELLVTILKNALQMGGNTDIYLCLGCALIGAAVGIDVFPEQIMKSMTSTNIIRNKFPCHIVNWKKHCDNLTQTQYLFDVPAMHALAEDITVVFREWCIPIGLSDEERTSFSAAKAAAVGGPGAGRPKPKTGTSGPGKKPLRPISKVLAGTKTGQPHDAKKHREAAPLERRPPAQPRQQFRGKPQATSC